MLFDWQSGEGKGWCPGQECPTLFNTAEQEGRWAMGAGGSMLDAQHCLTWQSGVGRWEPQCPCSMLNAQRCLMWQSGVGRWEPQCPCSMLNAQCCLMWQSGSGGKKWRCQHSTPFVEGRWVGLVDSGQYKH
ncbi:hypothetical protein B0H34DRAFT_682201 [Crassisporium funariophilum]|nr:hypothetical protein B0H34DRAFT_682201 [Crassisporium funariophilum]